MIKVEKGKVTVKGTAKEILGDLGAVVSSIYECLPETPSFDAERKKKILRNVFDFALMSKEEQQAELEKQAKEAISHVSDLLKMITEEKPEESEEKEVAE